TKTYDGNTTSTAVPTVTSTTQLAPGDVGTFSEVYENKNKGATHVMTLSGTIRDSGSVHMTSNYTITFATIGTGVINARAITVTAAASTKTYDGNTPSTAVPTVTSGTLAAGDVGTFSEVYDNKNKGTTHVMTPSGTIADSGSVNMTSNYTITFATIGSGVI